MAIGTDRDPWAMLQERLHPGSGAPAVEVTLHPQSNGQLHAYSGKSRVGVVTVRKTANDEPLLPFPTNP